MLSRLIRRTLFVSTTALLALVPSIALAGDVTWSNGAANLTWDTSSLNFTGAAWKNNTFDGAIFGATGVGSINVNTVINLHSLSVTSAGYTFGGSGTLNFSQAGSSTLAAANVTPSISSSATLAWNTTINSTFGLTVVGAGTITLGGSGHSFTGITSAGGSLGEAVNLQVGSNVLTTGGGFLNLGGATVLPASTRLGIGAGVVDIGANSVTLNGLTFSTTSGSGSTNGRLLGTGGGTVTFTDDVRSIGNLTGFGNQISANVNIPSGTLINRIGSASNGAAEIVYTGVISGNGGFLKTYGNTNSTTSFNNSQGGFALMGNNTYTGATVLSGNTTVTSNDVAGTNASTSLTLSNIGVQVIGANGSYASVANVNLYSNGNLVLDNVASVTASNSLPAVAAANLTNRLGTSANINMQGGLFQINGAANLASSQQVAALNIQNGFNILTLSAGTGTGTSIFSATGNLSITPGATVLFRSSTLPDTTAGAQATTAFTFAGTTPATVGSPGIIIGAIGAGTAAGTGSDFVRYISAGNVGIARLAAAEYTANYTTTGANVTVGAAQTVAASITVNAIRSGAFTTTINDNQTVTVTSGMILATGATTFAPQAVPITPGILSFGSNTGYFFSAGGNITANVPLSGSAGIIKASGNTLTLAGNNVGLTGGITVQGGTLAFSNTASTNFGGSLNIQVGAVTTAAATVFNNTSAINLGLAVTPDQVAVAPATLSLTGLATGTNFTNAINTLGTGGGNAASLLVTAPSVASFTLSGPISLGNNLTIAGTTTALTISGPITGNAGLYFTGAATTINITNSGNTFSGTLFAQSSATINLAGSTGVRTGGTTIAAGIVQFNDPANLGSGTVNMIAGTLTSTAGGAISLNNTVYVGGSSTLNTGASNVTLAGALNGLNGVTLTKTGAGTLLVTGAGNYQGNMTFGTGTGGLTLNGNGALAKLGALSMGNSTVLNVDNSAVNIARTGSSTNLTLTNGGVAGTGPIVNLTTNAAGSTMNFGTLTATGGTATFPNVATINLIDGGAGNNSVNFLSLASIAANNTLNFVGTTNFGQSAANGTHVFFAVAPTLTLGAIANSGFTGNGGTGQATYDATFGVILFVAPSNVSGTVIDNIGAPQLTTNTNFTTTGDTTAKTGAKLNSLILDVGNNLNLVQTYAAAPGNGGGTGNGSTPIDTLLLSTGQLTVTATGPKTITASTTGVIAFGVANAAIVANNDLTVAAGVTFSGTGGLTKTGTGNFTMNGTNSLNGDYALSAGAL